MANQYEVVTDGYVFDICIDDENVGLSIKDMDGVLVDDFHMPLRVFKVFLMASGLDNGSDAFLSRQKLMEVLETYN